MKSVAVRAREKRQLDRLETLVDSLFALVIALLVYSLPLPSDVDFEGSSTLDFLLSVQDELGVSALGIVLVVLYWVQNNAAFGHLSRTDNVHTVLSLTQLTMLLIYFYMSGLTLDFDDGVVLALQSGPLMLMGVFSLLAWSHACRGRELLQDDFTDEEAADRGRSMIAEPVTAGLTLLAAPFGTLVWSATWLTYIPLAVIVLFQTQIRPVRGSTRDHFPAIFGEKISRYGPKALEYKGI